MFFSSTRRLIKKYCQLIVAYLFLYYLNTCFLYRQGVAFLLLFFNPDQVKQVIAA